MPKVSDSRVNEILDSYVIAALWSSTNPDNEDEEYLDEHYSIEDIDDKLLNSMRADIRKFVEENYDDIEKSGMTDEQLGHDLWLSRNGHGAGFFDRNYGGIEDKLQDAARKMGGTDLYVSDGKIYAEGIYADGGEIEEQLEPYNKIVKELKKKGIDSSANYFDQYQGVYLNTPKGKIWTTETFTIGEKTKSKAKYSDAYLIGDDGKTSADKGDYFQLKPNYVFEGNTLVLKLIDGGEKRIEDPKVSDLPEFGEVDRYITYKKGTEKDVLVLSPEKDNDVTIQVSIDSNGKIDVSDLIDYLKNNFKKGGSVGKDKIKITDLVDTLKNVQHDGDEEDLRLHSEESFRWGADNEKDYKKAENEIDSIKYKGKGWNIYAWYDVSGFDYWMENMQETNYIQVTIAFDEDTISESEVPKIEKALDSALAEADAIESKYNYDPSSYKRGGGVKSKKWIAGALSGGKNKGALKRTALRKHLIRNMDENLSKTDLHKLERVKGITAKRAHLAETLRQFEKGGQISPSEIDSFVNYVYGLHRDAFTKKEIKNAVDNYIIDLHKHKNPNITWDGGSDKDLYRVEEYLDAKNFNNGGGLVGKFIAIYVHEETGGKKTKKIKAKSISEAYLKAKQENTFGKKYFLEDVRMTLSEGGDISFENQYEGHDAKEVWNAWSEKQRKHFLIDHLKLKEPQAKTLSSKQYKHLDDYITDALIDHVSEGQYKKGGKVGNEILHHGRYLTVERLEYEKGNSNKNGNLKLSITPEGKEEIEEGRSDEKSDNEIMEELFEDIRGNSELLYHWDIGEAGFGLTSAEGITDGYYYGDDGKLTDEGHDDAEVYWYPNYMVRSFIDDLLEHGYTIFTRID